MSDYRMQDGRTGEEAAMDSAWGRLQHHSPSSPTTILCDLCDGIGKKFDGNYCVRCEGFGTFEVTCGV